MSDEETSINNNSPVVIKPESTEDNKLDELDYEEELDDSKYAHIESKPNNVSHFVISILYPEISRAKL